MNAGTKSFWLEACLGFVFLALLAAAVLAQANPLLTLPNSDGAYNLFAGSQILRGRLPYVDFWNTKGPAMYYLNALGLWMGHGLRWGVWSVEYVFLLASITLLFILIRRQWGIGAASLGVIAAMIGLNAVLNGGNLTEEYALLSNTVALYVFWSGTRQASRGDGVSWRPWQYLVIGCMAGISFSFRANNVGIPAAIVLAILVDDGRQRRYRQAFWKMVLVGAGFLLPVLAGVWYFWHRGALSDYIGAVYLYNVRYSGSRAHTLEALLAGFRPENLGWPAWLALGGAILAVAAALRKLVQRAALTSFDILLALVLWIEIALSSVSWRMFGHYYITWAPAIALLSGYLFSQVIGWVKRITVDSFPRATDGIVKFRWPISGASNVLNQPALLFGGLIVGLALVGHTELAGYGQTASQVLWHRADGVERKDYLSNYVTQHTQAGDYVLLWPRNPYVNFITDREPPVQLLFYPQFDEGTITVEQGAAYLNDLAAHRPALIIDCADVHYDVPSLDAKTRQIQNARRDTLYDPPYIQQVFDYVAGHYHVEAKLPKCTVYRRNP